MSDRRKDHIGIRVAFWRVASGMTQTDLAHALGWSQPRISMIEAGHRDIPRRADLVDMAAALHVAVSDLLGQPPDPGDRLTRTVSAAVPQIRAALHAIKYGDRQPPASSPTELVAALRTMDELRRISDYAAMPTLLVALLPEAAAHHHDPVMLSRVACATSGCLRHLGYRDLAVEAAELSLHAALDSGLWAWIGRAQFGLATALPPEAAAVSAQLTARAINDLYAHMDDPDVMAMVGQLHLSASMAATVSGRHEDAAVHMDEAGRLADRLGEPPDGLGFGHLCFGPTNVGLWRMSEAIERDEAGRALERAGLIDPAAVGLRMRNRTATHLVDQGRAWALLGTTDHDQTAVPLLVAGMQEAPMMFALNPFARAAVFSIALRAAGRSTTHPQLRTLCEATGIDIGPTQDV